MPHVQWLLYYNVEYRKLLERKNEFVNVWICGSCLAYVQCMTILIGGKLLEYPNYIGLWDAPHENWDSCPLRQVINFYHIYRIQHVQSNLNYPNLDIRTWKAKKMQGQSTHCDDVTSLCMRSKPTSRSCLVRTSCCTAIKSSSNVIKKRPKCLISLSYTFLHAW